MKSFSIPFLSGIIYFYFFLYVDASKHNLNYILYLKASSTCALLNVGFNSVAYISGEDEDNKREAIVADNILLKFFEETCTLAFEDEIALPNINMRKKADDEERKAHKACKAMNDFTNVVDGGAISSATAKPRRKK